MSFRRPSHWVMTRASSNSHFTSTSISTDFNESLTIDAPSVEQASQISSAPGSASASDEKKRLISAPSKNHKIPFATMKMPLSVWSMSAHQLMSNSDLAKYLTRSVSGSNCLRRAMTFGRSRSYHSMDPLSTL